MSDDAEFDAFLKGDDALSRRLQAVPQAAPSAALDAAILQRARDLMAQEARPEAANDAGATTPAPQLARGLGWRWRVPAGIAATVLAGVFAHQAFRASADLEQSVGMPAPVEENVMILQPPKPEAPAAVPVETMPKPVPFARSAPAPAPVAASVAAPAPVPVPVPAPAPAAADSAPAMAPPPPAPEPMQRVEVTGSSIRRSASESSMPVTVTRSRELASDKSPRVEIAGSKIKRAMSELPPDEWFELIEAMLGKEQDKDVVAEWRRFRKMYPYYPVSEETEERIKALDK